MVNEELLRKLIRGECTAEELRQLKKYWKNGEYPELDSYFLQQWEHAANAADATESGALETAWRTFASKTNSTRPLLRFSSKTVLYAMAATAATVLVLFAWSWWHVPDQGIQWVMVENQLQNVKEVKLSDGTTVWLAKNSKLRYQQPFPADERSLELVGEAFFEVAKDSTRPFQVDAGGMRTTVLGTVFNLRARKDEPTVQVALVEGAVQLTPNAVDTSIVLKVGEQATYRVEEKVLLTSVFRDDAPFAWKNGIIHFQKANVQDVAKTLQDWYGISFTIAEGDLPSGRLVHRFNTHKLDLDDVMAGISAVMDYRFERKPDGSILIVPTD